MSKIILQPAGDRDGSEHFFDTIVNSVPLQRIRQHVSNTEYEILKDIYPSGDCKVWGVTPGGNNITKWNRIEVGDVTLFARKKRIFASAVTTFKLHNRRLAAELWDYNDNGQTWEYIYFLDQLKSHDISYLEFNRAVGYADNYIIQGFNVLRDDQSANVLYAFDLESDTYISEITKETFEDVVSKLEELEGTESEITSYRRLEQGYLQRHLFGNKTIATCACCHKEFPVSFLVTAHIKKRSKCTFEERIDPRIVMPMCKFGCDEVYEKGYVSVRDGYFIDMNKKPISSHMQNYIKNIAETDCEYYNNETQNYFDWHLSYHKRDN